MNSTAPNQLQGEDSRLNAESAAAIAGIKIDHILKGDGLSGPMLRKK